MESVYHTPFTGFTDLIEKRIEDAGIRLKTILDSELATRNNKSYDDRFVLDAKDENSRTRLLLVYTYKNYNENYFLHWADFKRKYGSKYDITMIVEHSPKLHGVYSNTKKRKEILEGLLADPELNAGQKLKIEDVCDRLWFVWLPNEDKNDHYAKNSLVAALKYFKKTSDTYGMQTLRRDRQFTAQMPPAHYTLSPAVQRPATE